jgi:hypothetical protein
MYGGVMDVVDQERDTSLYTEQQARLWMRDRSLNADEWPVWFDFAGDKMERGQKVRYYRLKGEYRETKKSG